MSRLTGTVLLGAGVFAAAAVAAPGAKPTSVTIAATPTTVVFGGTTTLSGTVAPAQARERVTVQAQPCGENGFKKVADAETTAAGAWSTPARPTVNTQYRARAGKVTSSTVAVGVSPRLVLTRVAKRKFKVRVFAAQSLAGKVITFQRFRRATGTWARVRRATLRQVASDASTVTSGITFRARVRSRTRVRVVLPPAQAAPCYLAGRSNTVRA